MADCKRFLLRSPWAARWAREMASDVTQERKQPKAEGVAAVERALTILAAFEQASEPLTLSELSRRSGLYKSTALRLLESLRKFSYVSVRSEEHTSELQSLMRISYAVFCLKKKKANDSQTN